MVSEKYCNICVYKGRKELERLYRTSELNLADVAKEIGTTEDEVKYHFDYHYEPEMIEAIAAESFAHDEALQVIDKKGKLNSAVTRIEALINAVIENNELGKDEIANLVKLYQEMRKTIMDLAKLEGDIMGVTQKQVNYIYNDYRTLERMVFEDLCPQCRARLINKIKMLPQNTGT